MNPYLVCSSCFESKLDKTEMREIFQDLPVGYGLTPAVLQNSHLFSVNRMTSDGCSNASGPGTGSSCKECEIKLFNRSPLKLLNQALMRHIVFGDNHGSGGIFVQPVHNSRT